MQDYIALCITSVKPAMNPGLPNLPDAGLRIWKVLVSYMVNFWQKKFDNGNSIGTIDFSICNVFAIHIFSIPSSFLSLIIKKDLF